MSTSRAACDPHFPRPAGWRCPLLLAALLAAAAPGQQVRVAGDRVMGADGRPLALSWATGLTRAGDLRAYRAAGFTALHLTWPAPPGVRFEDCQALAAAAVGLDLAVVVTLNPLDAVLGPGALDPVDAAAVRRAADWLTDAALAWSTVPGLLLYAVQDDLEERLAWSPAGFVAYLRQVYEDRLDRLNSHWQTAFLRFEEAAQLPVTAVDADRPGGIGRASLDQARWRMEITAGLLRLWAGALAAVDPEHPVIGGRMSRFRTLLIAPTELAGLQPAMYPRLGFDPLSHEPGAVAAANQAGRFLALPALQAAADPASLWRWTRLMCGRGAAGVTFDSWPALRDDPARYRAVAGALAEADERSLSAFRPTAGAAVVLQPFCRGPLVGDRSAYGYGGFGGDEPAGLYDLLRRSSCLGPLAVLTPRDLTRVPLSDYGCLFLPAAFDLSALEMGALRDYVAGGGVLFGDLGSGCLEPHGDLRHLPRELSEIWGVEIAAVQPLSATVLDDRQRERLRLVAPGEVAFPELAPELDHPGSLQFRFSYGLLPDLRPICSTAPEVASALLSAPTAFLRPVASDTRFIAEQGAIRAGRYGDTATAGLTVHALGRGLALFWGTFAWQAWRPDEPIFDAVHHGLMRQRPQLLVVDARRLADDGCAYARSGDRLWLHRVADTPVIATIDLPSLEGPLYVGGLNVVRRALPKASTAPLQVPDPPLIVRRIIDLAGAELRWEEPVPVSLWPTAEPVAADVVSYGPERIELRLLGTGLEAARDRTGRWQVLDPVPAGATLVIADGEYRLTPGSLHRAERRYTVVSGLPGARQVEQRLERETLTVGPDSRLVVRRELTDERLTLTPVEAAPTAPTP